MAISDVSHRLIFFHIGRTGGTSLTRYFQMLVPSHYVPGIGIESSLLEIMDNPEGPIFISGHYYIAPWIDILPTSWASMTVIRNPLYHLMSNYWHLNTHAAVLGDNSLNSLIVDAKQKTLECFLGNITNRYYERLFDNPQTRFVLGKECGALTNMDLRKAFEILEKVDFVGTTDRIDNFAAQVSSSLAWGGRRGGHNFPRAMGNFNNIVPIEDLPRNLLRQILNATELDAELYLYAQRRQSKDASMTIELEEPVGNTAKVVPVISVADLFRLKSPVTQGARVGIEAIIQGDEILLHPPQFNLGWAGITIDTIHLDRHSIISGIIKLAHPSAPPVRFGIEIWRDGAIMVSGSFCITSDQPSKVSISFAHFVGEVELHLKTQLIEQEANDYAWATFSGLKFL